MEDLIKEIENLEEDNSISVEEFLGLTRFKNGGVNDFQKYVQRFDSYKHSEVIEMTNFLKVMANGGRIKGFPIYMGTDICIGLKTNGSTCGLSACIPSCPRVQELIDELFFYPRPIEFDFDDLETALDKYREVISM
ncbi:MAG TPA: hypothetical protein VL125_12395 [Pelobium sp.]|nr:hypothetical protein [Pelobium sp.]